MSLANTDRVPGADVHPVMIRPRPELYLDDDGRPASRTVTQVSLTGHRVINGREAASSWPRGADVANATTKPWPKRTARRPGATVVPAPAGSGRRVIPPALNVSLRAPARLDRGGAGARAGRGDRPAREPCGPGSSCSTARPCWQRLTASASACPRRRRAARDLVGTFVTQPFDLTAGPMLRCTC